VHRRPTDCASGALGYQVCLVLENDGLVVDRPFTGNAGGSVKAKRLVHNAGQYRHFDMGSFRKGHS
jgi:hypothetical protein